MAKAYRNESVWRGGGMAWQMAAAYQRNGAKASAAKAAAK